MNPLQPQGLRRADYLERPGTLAVVRPTAPKADLSSAPANLLEPYILVAATGEVTAFNGHVDLGTGIRTALAQIVAEELDVAFERIVMLLGDTDVAPDQGPTIASETIQLSAIPLRRAAAQARQFLVARAAETLAMSASDLIVEDGVVRSRFEDNRRIAYGALIGAERIRLALADDVPVKTVSEHRIVGSSRPRVDLPAKATGALVFVHDMRVEGMLHGRVVRPPYAGFDSGEHVGRSLIRVDETSIAHLPGVVSTVVEGDFVGIVAEREEQAEAAMRALKVEWRETPKPPSLDDIAAALTSNPSRPRVLLDKGDVDGAIAAAAKRLTRAYVWPFQLHGSIGPSAALADVGPHGARIWSGTQNPLWMRRDLALLLDLPENAIDVIRMEAAGCYGRNGADDATADAALLSRAVGRPVRVQLTRDQEHQWEPKGAGQLMNVDGGLDSEGGVAAYDFATRYPSNAAPTLALLLTGRIAPIPAVTDMGDRTAIGPYDFANHRVTVHDMAPIARAAWLRGVSALPNTFAHESYIDELASEAGVDPVAYRLRYLRDPRGVDLIKQVAAKVGWEPRTGARKRRDEGGNLIGQGFAYAVYVHSKFPGLASAWSAWAADVAVNPGTGEVSLTRVTVGQDSGLMINPEGVRHQIHGNVIQSTSRVLKEEVTFSDIAVTTRDWGTYPLLTFPELPSIDVLMASRPNDEPLGVGESASVPSAAAIANAIFDATGVRFREPPFTPDRILAGLREAGLATEAPTAPQRLAAPLARAAPEAARVVRAVACDYGGRRRRAWRREPAPSRRDRADRPPGRRRLFGRDDRARTRARECRRLHRLPHQDGWGSARRGAPVPYAFRNGLCDQHHPRRGHGNRRMVLRSLRARHARRGGARWAASVSGLSLHVVRKGRRSRPSGALCLPYGRARRVGSERARGLASALLVAPADGGMEYDVPSAGALPAAARSRRRLESRRLSRGRPWPLLGLPFAPQRARRGNEGGRSSRGRRGRRLVRPASERHVPGADRLERAGFLRLSPNRPFRRAWGGGRPDGGGGGGT